MRSRHHLVASLVALAVPTVAVPHDDRAPSALTSTASAASATKKSGQACNPIPAGKRLAVAGVWVDMSSTNTADVDEAVATSTTCQLLLSLRTARLSLTNASACFTEEDVDMVVLTNESTLAANQKAMYEAAGLIVKDVAHYPAMKEYAAGGSADGDRGDALDKDVIHMFKLAPLWDEDYAAVLVSDTDAFVHPGDNGVEPTDIFNTILDPHAPAIIYSHGTGSPINAGMVMYRPKKSTYKLFEEAVRNQFDYAKGWGGHYDRAMLATFRTTALEHFSGQSAAQQAKKKEQHPECYTKDGGAWCFIGSDQDQGMLAHMIASTGDDGELVLPSKDLRTDDDGNEKNNKDTFIYDHYAFSPKPWAVAALKELSQNGGLSKGDDEHLASFWRMYSNHYSQTWSSVPAPFSRQCPAEYACFFHQSLRLDKELKSDDGRKKPILRDIILDHLDADACSAESA